MARPTLIPYDGEENPFIFFSDDVPAPLDFLNIPDKVKGKIYCDGSHYLLSPCYKSKPRKEYVKKPQGDELREVFDRLYSQAVETFNERRRKSTYAKRRAFLLDNLCSFFNDNILLERYVDEHIKKKLNNLHSRKKRFRRKAYLNCWTHFVTVTYRDGTHTEETFRIKLRKCLMNLHTRRGWRYMGVFERGEENGRLHFHCLLYVPRGEMVGKITERKDYSTKQGKMQITHINSFFERKFGKNDFNEIDRETLCHDGRGVEYILKYLEKSGERITYSRGIPSALYAEIDRSDIIMKIQDFVTKYILSDDVINWRDDIACIRRKIPPEQITIYDLSHAC